MNFLAAIATSLLPWALLLVPGLGLVVRQQRSVIEKIVEAVLWSIGFLTLGSLISFSVLGRGYPVLLIAALYTLWQLWRYKAELLAWPTRQYILLAALLVLAFYTLASLPFIFLHDGLPTGDGQKALYWAQRIVTEKAVPDYDTAIEQLNRDPVDFYTPGLHTFTALLVEASPAPIISLGFLALALGIAGVLLTVALARLVCPDARWWLLGTAAFLLIASHTRYLRYIREPGYHYQNLVGEILLFGGVYVLLRLMKRWEWSLCALGIVISVSLLISHQFSAFLGAFIYSPLLLLLAWQEFRARNLATSVPRLWWVGLVVAVVAAVSFGFALGLHHKLPHLFTSTPHLLHQVPQLLQYTQLMGGLFMLLTMVGLVLLPTNVPRLAFALTSLVLLLLSQGPRLGIDIPPVRALFYLAIPGSVVGAYAVTRLWPHARVLVALILIGTAVSNLAAAFTLSHTVRTNSTLTPGLQTLSHYLGQKTDRLGVVIDDYNRRSASWLLLSGKPMFTRLASDIAPQMAESKQSKVRKELYLNQLAYEKMFSLGSLPEITALAQENNVGYLTGIANSSNTSLVHNPSLEALQTADDITLYKVVNNVTSSSRPADIASWLLRPSTLANDIGDNEDTFLHLPAALVATRLSPPLYQSNETWRTTTAPLIPLAFNVGDYVQALWSPQNSAHPETAVEVYIELQHVTPGIAVRTPTGHEYPLISEVTILRMPASEMPYDANGFITLMLRNDNQQEVAIDVIALGLARVP